MQAMNGRRGRLVGCAVAVVFALSALLASSAGAIPPVKESYLAMGDSLAFGYSQQLFNENLLIGDPASQFERGYDHWYFEHLKPLKEGVQEQNKGCPGETTDSMIGNGPLGAVLDPEGESPCAYHKAGFPLHSEYGGTKSQLESTMETIAIDAALGKPVTHVSLNIGANDELHQIGKCEAEVAAEFGAEGKSKYGATPEEAVQNCIVSHVPALFTHIITNIGSILFALREGSKFGGINYTGPIIFVTNPDPYGNVCGEEAACRAAFGMKPGQKELLEGSNNLAALLASELEAHLKAPFGVCFADPQNIFDPRNRYEPSRLQGLTNMTNFTESNGRKNGPDIHPTPHGYVIMDNVMVTACG